MAAWLCFGLALPVLVTFYSPELGSDAVEAAPSDAFSITDPVTLSEAPLIRVERGMIAFIDANGNPIPNGAAGLPPPAGSNIRLFNATLSFADGGIARKPTDNVAAPLVDALVGGRFETLSLRRTTVIVNLLGSGPEPIGDVKADISLRRKGYVSIKGNGLLRGQRIGFDVTASPGQIERKPTGAPRIPVKLALKTERLDLTFDGRMAATPHEMALNGIGELSIPSVRQVARMFGAYWPPGSGLRDLSIRGEMSMSRQTLAFENAVARMDGNEATGVLALQATQPRPMLTGTLAFKSFDVKSYLLGSVNEPAEPLSWTSLAAGVLTVPLGMHLDADLRISADKAQIGGLEFGRLAATLALKDGRLLADLADLKFNGGEGGGQITADFTGYLPKVTIRGKLDRVDMAMLSSRLSGHVLGQGQANIVADLSGAGATLQEVIRGLAGKVVVRSPASGKLGLDLRSLATSARDREHAGWGAAGRGTTSFDQLDLKLVLRDGTILTENAEMKSVDGNWSGTGVVNLLSDRLDLRLSQAPPPGGASSPIAVLELNGPLREPRVRAAYEK